MEFAAKIIKNSRIINNLLINLNFSHSAIHLIQEFCVVVLHLTSNVYSLTVSQINECFELTKQTIDLIGFYLKYAVLLG